jgi:ribonucleotide monophosphatase NagD (HAD superfamily)
VIGEGGLLQALHTNGYSVVDHDPDYVVVGEGRSLNFEMFETAVRMIQKGANSSQRISIRIVPRSRACVPAAARSWHSWRRPPDARPSASASRVR